MRKLPVLREKPRATQHERDQRCRHDREGGARATRGHRPERTCQRGACASAEPLVREAQTVGGRRRRAGGLPRVWASGHRRPRCRRRRRRRHDGPSRRAERRPGDRPAHDAGARHHECHASRRRMSRRRERGERARELRDILESVARIDRERPRDRMRELRRQRGRAVGLVVAEPARGEHAQQHAEPREVARDVFLRGALRLRGAGPRDLDALLCRPAHEVDVVQPQIAVRHSERVRLGDRLARLERPGHRERDGMHMLHFDLGGHRAKARLAHGVRDAVHVADIEDAQHVRPVETLRQSRIARPLLSCARLLDARSDLHRDAAVQLEIDRVEHDTCLRSHALAFQAIPLGERIAGSRGRTRADRVRVGARRVHGSVLLSTNQTNQA